jgi:hypothetical protein
MNTDPFNLVLISADHLIAIWSHDGKNGYDQLHCPAGHYEKALIFEDGGRHYTIGRRAGEAVGTFADREQWIKEHTATDALPDADAARIEAQVAELVALRKAADKIAGDLSIAGVEVTTTAAGTSWTRKAKHLWTSWTGGTP